MASTDCGEDPTCLHWSFKIGKVVYDVTLTHVKLSWVKKGDAVEKSGMGSIVSRTPGQDLRSCYPCEINRIHHW